LSLSPWDSEPIVARGNRASAAAILDRPLLNTLSDDRAVRFPMIVATSLLVLVAFAFCGEKTRRNCDDGGNSSRSGIRGWLADRYRKPGTD
jgi:hypothetical protein